MLNTTCSKCGSDNTQSFKVAHKLGTSSGFGVGVGMSGDGEAGVGTGFSRQRTGIAQITKPPSKGGSVVESLVTMLVAVIIFNFVGAFASLFIAWATNSELASVSVWIAGLFIGFLAALAFSIFCWKRTAAQQSKQKIAHKAAMMKWEHSWICLKCGHTFYVR